MLNSEDKQISLTDPDARSMATSGRDTGIVGYNVQSAVDATNHLIVVHEVTNVGTDRQQLATMADKARTELGSIACETAGITVTLSKPMTSNAKAAGRFGKQDFIYKAADDIYRCPAGERLAYRYTSEEEGKMLRRYWTTVCRACSMKAKCTTGPSAGSRGGSTKLFLIACRAA
jgi:hypothetical protein